MLQPLEKYLNEFLDEAVPRVGTSGIDCVIYQNHCQVYRHASGYMDVKNQIPVAPNALYNIYSATKIMTSVALMQLLEKGKLQLREPLELYLPEFSNMKVKYGTFTLLPAANKIRIIDLLKMTSGISYDSDSPSIRELLQTHPRASVTNALFVKAISREPLQFEPGTHWQYGYNCEILGRLIEVISGETLGNYMKKNIFEPLGMTDTGFYVPEEKKKRIAPQYVYDPSTHGLSQISSETWSVLGESGGGGIITTVDDYITFADAIACGGVGKTKNRILSENSIKLMGENQLNETCLEDFHKVKPDMGIGWGLGMSVIFDPSAALTLAPAHSLSWGGLGGCMNQIDPVNKLSLFVAMHAISAPKDKFLPNILNILYSHL